MASPQELHATATASGHRLAPSRCARGSSWLPSVKRALKTTGGLSCRWQSQDSVSVSKAWPRPKLGRMLQTVLCPLAGKATAARVSLNRTVLSPRQGRPQCAPRLPANPPTAPQLQIRNSPRRGRAPCTACRPQGWTVCVQCDFQSAAAGRGGFQDGACLAPQAPVGPQRRKQEGSSKVHAEGRADCTMRLSSPRWPGSQTSPPVPAPCPPPAPRTYPVTLSRA